MSESENEVEPNKKTHRLNQYQRRKLVNIFSENGGGPTVGKNIIKKYSKLNFDIIGDFVNKQAKVTQEHVGEEVETEDFVKLEKWIGYFKENQLDQKCGNELPLLLKAIALAEPSPECNSDEVDFRMMYAWLADVMQGHIPMVLNAQSQLFLVEQFKDLMRAANNSESENDLLEMMKTISEKIERDDSDSLLCEDDFIDSVDPLELVFKKT